MVADTETLHRDGLCGVCAVWHTRHYYCRQAVFASDMSGAPIDLSLSVSASKGGATNSNSTWALWESVLAHCSNSVSGGGGGNVAGSATSAQSSGVPAVPPAAAGAAATGASGIGKIAQPGKRLRTDEYAPFGPFRAAT